MLRRYEPAFRVVLMLVDAGLALATLALAASIHINDFPPQGWVKGVPDPLILITAYCAGWVAVLGFHGLYRPRVWWSFKAETNGILRAAASLALGTLGLLFLLHLDDVSRSYLLFLFPLQIFVAIGSRIVIRFAFRAARRRGRNIRNALIIGKGAEASGFALALARRWDLGLRTVGILTDDPADAAGLRYLGSIDRLPDTLVDEVIDEVIVCLPLSEWQLVETICRFCADQGKTVRLPINVPELAISAGHVEDLDGRPVLSFVNGPDRAVALGAKRLLDLVGAVAGLIILSPVLGLAALAIFLTDGRPVIFRQSRAGLHGRPFQIVKFRTMVRDADGMRADLRAQNEVDGASFKMTDDPRITRIGHILRRTSIDELPQLWNVLVGDMSLVGPRPHPFDDVAGYDGWHRRRLSMKPGITGLWQVGGRRETSFDRWVEQDLEYIDGWSLRLDLELLFRTIPALIRAEGR